MPPRPTESSGASTALAVVGLTTQIAVAATDGIPIVKQVLAVAARIITLVEDIEKRRDALHGLADTARTLVQSIETVVSDRELGEEVARRLVALHTVLHSIEALLEKHRAKTPLRKALSYAFTISKRIDDFNQEMSRAVQGFQVVAAADTSAQVRDNSQHIGEFRRIRHGDVEDLILIEEREVFLTGYSSQIYSAKVGGCVCILRSFVRNSEVGVDVESVWDEWHRRRVIEHDQLLEKLSRVHNLHRNVARLYGRSSGEHFGRFNVMNIEFRIHPDLPGPPMHCDGRRDLEHGTADPGQSINRAAGRLSHTRQEALCHLNERGITWNPDLSNSVFVDGTGAPIIGLHNDLRSPDEWSYVSQISALGKLLEHGLKSSWQESSINADGHHPLAICTRGTTRAKPFNTMGCMIPRRLIPSLDEKISRYLQNALASCADELNLWIMPGCVVLRSVASGRTLCSGFHTRYWAYDYRRDDIEMYRVEERDDELICLVTSLVVPDPVKDEIRKELGITLSHPRHTMLFLSNGDPADPSSMSFRSRFS